LAVWLFPAALEQGPPVFFTPNHTEQSASSHTTNPMPGCDAGQAGQAFSRDSADVQKKLYFFKIFC